ncbi:hypothetical protein PAXRUDRAFT_15097 [Paxillus rubicundulus Ve08.2h10]|uniref:Uncharacterized protein n=1 Tax=Paxillus rubicundulus Ve08.2h10 TaxID=930991 RepID=A0A0D0DJ97_9AGAM|nr:hypothetical protein PAXRUDRAFT_15097 [Paxillus rubicundulus Ve08.2h10]
MSTKSQDQNEVIIPDLTIKDLLSEITPGFTLLSPFDRSLPGDHGKIVDWMVVVQLMVSRSPMFRTTFLARSTWEASDSLRKHLARSGIVFRCAPGGWREAVYRVFKERKFIEAGRA